jgi:flagellar hook protein FlgE
MNSTYYTSLSGMIAASIGLQNTSNNIANMQSCGFKRSDVFYSSLSNDGGQGNLGSGVKAHEHTINFSAGRYLKSDSASDVAIVGNGFFIVKLTNNEYLYTRDGEFEFNSDGVLVDKHSGGLVQGYDKKGDLVTIQQFGAKTNPGKATHSMTMKGEFIIIEKNNPNEMESSYDAITFNVTVFDEQGRKHDIAVQVEAPNTPGTQTKNDYLTWTIISASCKDANISFNPQSIQFNENEDGTPLSGANTLTLTLNGTQPITLEFGEYMSDKETSVRLFKKGNIEHTQSMVTVTKQDGYAMGKQTDYSFDDNGYISYHYDNGQIERGIPIALATFDDLEHTLVQANDNLFRAKSIQHRHIGRANTSGFGAIQPKKLEEANVESTVEFGNIVILQRMFQACSQLLDIDKQLFEELYKK